MRDNQGRNLDAVKQHFEMLGRHHAEGVERSHQMFLDTVAKFPLADWVKYNNVLVLRAGKSRFVGVPTRGGTNAKNFDVIDIVDLVPVVRLTKNEVRNWLWRASQTEDAVASAEK